MDGAARSRRETALRAARAVARRLELDDAGARVLRDAHSTIVLLPEPRVVAKVATSTLDDQHEDVVRREVAVGVHLAARGAPVVPPLGDDCGPHEVDGVLLTLWAYCEAQPPDEPDARAVGRALRALHERLADVPAPLPPLREKLDRAAALFVDPAATPGLEAADRRLGLRAYARLEAQLAPAADHVPLHGDAHMDNVVWTADGPLYLDFEAACLGPVEWDAARLPEEAREIFPPAAEEAVRLIAEAGSFCVAAWCWAQPGRAPQVDEAARFHLDVLRRYDAEDVS